MTRPVDAAGAVDAQNAPTAPWKTADAFPTAPTGHFTQGDISISLRTGTFLFRFDKGDQAPCVARELFVESAPSMRRHFPLYRSRDSARIPVGVRRGAEPSVGHHRSSGESAEDERALHPGALGYLAVLQHSRRRHRLRRYHGRDAWSRRRGGQPHRDLHEQHRIRRHAERRPHRQSRRRHVQRLAEDDHAERLYRGTAVLRPIDDPDAQLVAGQPPERLRRHLAAGRADSGHGGPAERPAAVHRTRRLRARPASRRQAAPAR